MTQARRVVLVLVAGFALAGCGQARLANGQPCLPSNESGQTIYNPLPTDRTPQVVNVWPGDTVTVQLVEGMGFEGFPWNTPRSSDIRVLRPIAVCAPPYVSMLETHLTSFRALQSGRATITAPVDMTYANPPVSSGLAPAVPLEAIVNVAPDWIPWVVRLGIAAIVVVLIMYFVIVGWRWPMRDGGRR